MSNQKPSDGRPYMVDEFGETTDLRPGGCPHCGEETVAVYSRSCWRCHGRFEPIEPFGR